MTLSNDELLAFGKMERHQVLSLPMQERTKYLYSLRAKHKKLELIGKDLIRLLTPYNELNILFLIGATGVGKTTLIQSLVRTLIVNENSKCSGSSAVPFIYIAAPANGDKSISWTTIYREMLRQGDDVAISRKLSTSVNTGTMSVRYKTLAALRESLDSMLINRKVRVVVIDEALHLLRFGNYSALMDTLKSLSDNAHIKLILVGSYDLFDLACDYGQVARRGEILHFERYYKEDKEDRAEFSRIVSKLQERWPCEQVPNFSAILDALLESTLGCIGLLKALFLQALSLQLENKEEWDPKLLPKAAKSVKLLDKIRKEIEVGEEKVKGATYGESIFSEAILSRIGNQTVPLP